MCGSRLFFGILEHRLSFYSFIERSLWNFAIFFKFSKDSVLGYFLLCAVRYSGEIEAFYRKTDFQ